MKRALTQMFTGRDNFTVDAIRVLAVVAVFVGVGLDVFVVVWKALHPDATVTFDLIAYGTGLGGLILAAGGALRLKAETEPTDSTTMTQTTETTVRESK